jgi:16S rRNA C967 or C1407 C5-methylase (RsmB/RsmF family)
LGNKSEKLKGADGFDHYFAALYGERWAGLKSALLAPPRQTGWDTGLLQPYYLDAGSAAAALSLPLSGDEQVLDMCAAPGGKSLVIASRLGSGGSLVSNERSQDRRNRLIRVLDEHLPPESRSRVSVSGYDGALMCRYERESYSRILLDAPCSSERHVLASTKHLALWSPGRIRNLAVQQWALLSSAFLLLAPGGYLLYATCALSPQENDGVVEKLLKKYPEAQNGETVDSSFALSEKTTYGRHVLPDISEGAGPLYFVLIQKEEKLI